MTNDVGDGRTVDLMPGTVDRGPGTVDLKSVGESVLASRGGAHGSWPWTRKLLAAADAQFQSRWRSETIDAAAALEIRLPPHAGEPCKGDLLTLVGANGATVREAAATLDKVAAAYARHNESCMGRIEFAAAAPLTRVVLCTAPLNWEEYADVAPADGALYCVDGFHRLVAWAWKGRLNAGEELPIWLAGSIHM
jgi:hypothetical protein